MACRNRSSSRHRGSKPPTLRHPKHVAHLALGQTQFAWKLYKACRTQPQLQASGNLCFSPLLLHRMLSMSYTGARYESAVALRSALHLDQVENDAAVNLAYGDVSRVLQVVLRLSKDAEEDGLDAEDDGPACKPVVLHAASRLYLPITHCLLDQWGVTLRNHYASDIAKVPFHTDKERARQEINQWAEEVTEQTIRELVRPLGLPTFVSIVLASALYFRAAWDRKWAGCGKMKVAAFYPFPDEAVPVLTLRARTLFRHGTIEDADCRVVELPFADDGRFALFLFLPNQVSKDALENLESKLNAAQHLHCLDDFLQQKSKLKVVFPKFQPDEPLSLGKLLQSDHLAIGDLFVRGKADLSGISGNNNLHLSHVEHKVRFDMADLRKKLIKKSDTSVPSKPLQEINTKVQKSRLEFNRPFIYLVRDNYLNMFLIMGCVRKLAPFNPD